jgi:hypothetical protein
MKLRKMISDLIHRKQRIAEKKRVEDKEEFIKRLRRGPPTEAELFLQRLKTRQPDGRRGFDHD